jgi:nitrite reductase/ring-hydroxylating ferredoxin subunit
MNEITRLRNLIEESRDKIHAIQNECPHPEIAIRVKSIGMNEAGEKWRNCECGLCEKSFTRGMP